MKMKMKIYLPLLLLYTIVTGMLLSLHAVLLDLQIDIKLLHAANIFFLFIFIISITIHSVTAKNNNPHVFVRGVMASMILKMFATVIAIFVYSTFSGDNFNKKGIFIALCLYLPYLATEILASRQKSQRKNA